MKCKVTVTQTSRLLNVTRPTVYKMLRDGRLKWSGRHVNPPSVDVVMGVAGLHLALSFVAAELQTAVYEIALNERSTLKDKTNIVASANKALCSGVWPVVDGLWAGYLDRSRLPAAMRQAHDYAAKMARTDAVEVLTRWKYLYPELEQVSSLITLKS